MAAFLGPTLRADVDGDCVPGANQACGSEGAACIIQVNGAGVGGVCTTLKTSNNSNAYCFCAVQGKQMDETPVKAQAMGPIPVAPATVVFNLTPDAVGVASIPAALGGGVVNYSSFAGSVTLQSQPTSDSNIDAIYLLGGTLTQASVTLPNGIETGTNVFTFFPQSSPSGTLNRTTGEFMLSADGRITNSLYSASRPVLTEGDYFGTVNMLTGLATLDTRTFDTYPAGNLVPALGTWGGALLGTAVLIAGLLILMSRRLKPVE